MTPRRRLAPPWRCTLAALQLALIAATAYGAGSPGCIPGRDGSEGPCESEARALPGTGTSYKAFGVVKRVDVSAGSITVAHDEMKALRWPAMTMVFRVSRPDVLRDIVVGHRYELTFVRDGNQYVVTDMRPQ